MGLNVDLSDPSRPKCLVVEDLPFHSGGVGQHFMNGAVIAGMFDFVIGLTALPHAAKGNFATTSVNMKLIKPVQVGGVYAVAECRREIGRRLLVESTWFDGSNEPCCFASGEVRIAI